MFFHYLTEGKRVIQVVPVIHKRMGDAFSDRFQPCEMDHRVKPVLCKDPVHSFRIRDIRFIMRHGTADDLLDAADGLRTAVHIIIHDDRLMAGRNQLHTGMRTDKTGAAGQKNLHGILL